MIAAPYQAGRTPSRPRVAWLLGYGPRADSAEAPKADTFSHRAGASSISARLCGIGLAFRTSSYRRTAHPRQREVDESGGFFRGQAPRTAAPLAVDKPTRRS